jgi:hypothetical protein
VQNYIQYHGLKTGFCIGKTAFKLYHDVIIIGAGLASLRLRLSLPAALLRAFRYRFDSRDQNAEAPVGMPDHTVSIWGCKSRGKCVKVCPKQIDVRKWLTTTKHSRQNSYKADG